ncbi:efflux RND transporter periplasmic adaptor subunit [Paenibacillus thermotolerans]|uniref:efflux RND transporter periplasmic adaptor subunit n=1 Tax=Paenibacillus thermotolerans TaxID=3027807 RepID=UPI0023677F3C|nr:MULTISPECIES: HlyD family efflux transporter periplasmic adaptor subunit [unclassified Paenibacillus]
MRQKAFHLSFGRVTALGALIAACAFSGGCSLLPEEKGPLKPPLVKPAQATARTVDAKVGSIIRQISGSAYFVPTRISYHPLAGSGNIESVNVWAGNTVKKGDVLLVLNNGDIDVELLQRELEYERKKAALEDAAKLGDDRTLRIAKLDFELAKLLFDKTKAKAEKAVLRAQIDGIVTFVAELKPGDWVEAGRPLVAIADPEGMRLALNASGNPVMADVTVGMDAKIDFKGKTYEGKVTQTPRSAPATEDARLRDEYAKTIYIELSELPPDAELGALADVAVTVAKRENVIVLPKRGIRSYFGRTFVQIMDGEKRREIDVETGLENATEIEVISGLDAGMKVILQ